MIVHCPKCQARYRVEEKHFGGRTRIQLLCTKCQTTFPVNRQSEPQTAPAAVAGPAVPEATLVTKKGGLRLPEGKSVTLSVTQGPLKGKSFPVTKPRVVLGRSGMDIVVEDATVSRKHCVLEIYGSTALVVDLGSANGTFVGEERVETHELEHLSEFRIGDTTLMLMMTHQQQEEPF